MNKYIYIIIWMHEYIKSKYIKMKKRCGIIIFMQPGPRALVAGRGGDRRVPGTLGWGTAAARKCCYQPFFILICFIFIYWFFHILIYNKSLFIQINSYNLTLSWKDDENKFQNKFKCLEYCIESLGDTLNNNLQHKHTQQKHNNTFVWSIFFKN